jgi:hypothetical protein
MFHLYLKKIVNVEEVMNDFEKKNVTFVVICCTEDKHGLGPLELH